jgi:hypothetical protein
VTQLIDEIKVTISLRHDEVDSHIYGGKTDLREWLKQYWPSIGTLIASSANKGRMTLMGVDIVWENSGLYEVPELGGGDN